MVLPIWCWLTQVVWDKIQEGYKMGVCVCVKKYQHNDTKNNSSTEKFYIEIVEV